MAARHPASSLSQFVQVTALSRRARGLAQFFVAFVPFVPFVSTVSPQSAMVNLDRHGARRYHKRSMERWFKDGPGIPSRALHAAATNEAPAVSSTCPPVFFLEETHHIKNVPNKAVNPLKTNDLIIGNRLKAVRL
jgi:hypothetical protein